MSKVYRVRFAGGRGNKNAADMPQDPPMMAMDEALAQINTLPGVLKPLEATDLAGVRGCYLVNDLPFKDGGRRIKATGVQQCAPLMRGAPYIFNHEERGTHAIPSGRGFAHVSATAPSGAFWVGPRYYVLNHHPIFNMEGLIASIDGGVMCEVSVGMYAESFTCSLCGEEAGECDHVPRAKYDGQTCLWEYDQIVEVDEFSAVMSGAIDGTRYFLAAKDERDDVVDADALEAQVIERAQKRDPSLFERMAIAAIERQKRTEQGLRSLYGIRKAS